MVVLQALHRVIRQLVNVADTQLDPLPRRLGSKHFSKWRCLDGHLSLVLLETVDSVVLTISDQTEGQLVALEQNSVWVFLLLSNGIAERTERLLADDSAVGKPFSVGFDASNGLVSALVASSFGNLSLGVALRLALFEDVELLDFLCAAVEVFSDEGMSVPWAECAR